MINVSTVGTSTLPDKLGTAAAAGILHDRPAKKAPKLRLAQLTVTAKELSEHRLAKEVAAK